MKAVKSKETGAYFLRIVESHDDLLNDEKEENMPSLTPKDSEASRHQDRDNMSEGLNANWKEYYPDLIEEDGSGWQPSVNRRLNVRAGGERWPKEVLFVRKLPPITQPTMERDGQRRMNDAKALGTKYCCSR